MFQNLLKNTSNEVFVGIKASQNFKAELKKHSAKNLLSHRNPPRISPIVDNWASF